MIGEVKFFNQARGYGFIRGEDGQDYFFHQSFVQVDMRSLPPSTRVEFEPFLAFTGLQAKRVSPLLRPARLKYNPFTPQDPVVDPRKFAGRGEVIRNAVDALFNHKNIVISGDRGIGKSSVAYQLLFLLQGERTLLERLNIETDGYEFSYLIAEHRCVPGNTVADIFDSLAHSLEKTIGEKQKLKGKSVEWGVDLKFFKAGEKRDYAKIEVSEIVTRFVRLVQSVFEKASVWMNGICFLIDEIDCLPREIELGPFFKAVNEAFRFQGYEHVSFIAAGVTGTMTRLLTEHASVNRVFEHIELMRMSEPELVGIVVNALTDTGVEVQESTVRRMISLADRFPQPMQLLGYHTYRIDDDDVLDADDLDEALHFVINNLKRQEFSELQARAGEGVSELLLREIAASELDEVSMAELVHHTGMTHSAVASAVGDLVQKGLLVKVKQATFKIRDPLFKIYLRWVLDLV